MTAPQVRGWCPGAYRPMRSGDGLVVRVRPRLAALTGLQAMALAHLARRYGSGIIDLTNRANLQIRGVAEADHPALLEGLAEADLLDADPALEQRRNMLVTPFWTPGDLTARLAEAVLAALSRLPDLPAKVGIAVDTGPGPVLTRDPADFRFERSGAGLILRADGAAGGRLICEETAVEALLDMAAWFDRHRTGERRRMASVVARVPLPEGWADTAPAPAPPRPVPGSQGGGMLLGAAFGQMDAAALAALVENGGVSLRVTPWRMIWREGAMVQPPAGFIASPDDPLLRVDACPGAPFCPQATVETRALARRLAPRLPGSLHVSGCAKGCASSRPADVTLIGRDGYFDLVEKGCAWDVCARTGLTPEQIMALGPASEHT